MKPDSDSLLLRTEDVARELRIGRTKVVAMIGSGELPVVRMGRSVRVPRAALVRWVEDRTARHGIWTERAA